MCVYMYVPQIPDSPSVTPALLFLFCTLSGSPFSLYLGIEKPPERKDSKSKKKKSSNRENKDPKVSVCFHMFGLDCMGFWFKLFKLTMVCSELSRYGLAFIVFPYFLDCQDFFMSLSPFNIGCIQAPLNVSRSF